MRSHCNYVTDGMGMDRTTRVPKSVLCLRVDKGQGLRSGILSSTNLVLLPNEIVETRVKIVYSAVLN